MRDYEILKQNYGVNNVKLLPDGVPSNIVNSPNKEKYFREKFGIYNENLFVYIGQVA